MTTNNTTIAPATDAHPDAAILAAWERNKAARAIYDALPISDLPCGAYTPEEQALWDVMDETEEFIVSTTATTPAGVEAQLWIALGHQITLSNECAAALRGDMDWFDANGTEIDFVQRMTLAAIRSVRAIGGAA
jgi:hypothetical protein